MHFERDEDISIVMTSFFMKIVGFWVADDERQERRRKFTKILTVTAIATGVSNQIIELFYQWHDFGERTYIICNLLCLLLISLKIFVLLIHNETFNELIWFTKRNFWHANYDTYEKSVLVRCKNICTLFICSFTFCNQCSVGSVILAPIIANRERNASDRILPYTLRVDLPLTETPYYETAFAVEVITLTHVCICYFCFDNFLCLMNIHVAGQFRILQYRFSNICRESESENDDLILKSDPLIKIDRYYEALKTCIRQHQDLNEYCKKLEQIYTFSILGQIIVFNVLLCLVGYQVLLAEVTTMRRVSYSFHTIGSFIELLMFTFSCDGMIEESGKLGTSAYSGLWQTLPVNKTGRSLRQDVKFIIMKSTRYCCLTACGFFPVSLQTYTMILSTAMSYFTLLKQTVGT